jgi:hypothetical protein
LNEQFGNLASSLDHSGEASSREWRTPLRREHEWRLCLLFTLQPPQGAQFVAEDRVRAGRALLDPADVQGGRSEIDLLPAQVDQLGDPKAVPIRHEDHGRIPVAVAVALGGLDQPFDLGLQVKNPQWE